MQPATIEDDVPSLMASPEAVRELETYMLSMPQVDLATEHLVHGGMYARTILIPAGTLLTGAETKCDNICVVVGDITVTTDDGTIRLTGHHIIPASAGFKRAGIAHADTLWTTFMQTDEVEVQAIERQMTDETELLQTNRSGIEYEHTPALKGE